MTFQIVTIDNKGLFYQRKGLELLFGLGLLVVVFFAAVIYGYLKYQESILKIMPIEIVYAIFILFALNCVIFLIFFLRAYSVEKKVYKISESGITQLTYFNRRVFPESSHINWSEISTFNVSGKGRNQVLYVGSHYVKFIIYKKYQIAQNNFEEVIKAVRQFLAAYGKTDLVK